MSMEAQFYEARRREHNIQRRQSLRTPKEIDKQTRQVEYQTLFIPVRIFHQDDQQGRRTAIPMHYIRFINNGQSLYQRDRDIYPRPLPITTNIRRYVQHAKLRHRFSSTDYLQQW